MLLGSFTIGVGFFVIGAEADNDHADGQVDLWGSKTHAVVSYILATNSLRLG